MDFLAAAFWVCLGNRRVFCGAQAAVATWGGSSCLARFWLGSVGFDSFWLVWGSFVRLKRHGLC